MLDVHNLERRRPVAAGLSPPPVHSAFPAYNCGLSFSWPQQSLLSAFR